MTALSVQNMTKDERSEATLTTSWGFVSTTTTWTVFMAVCHAADSGPKKSDNSYNEDECVELNEKHIHPDKSSKENVCQL